MEDYKLFKSYKKKAEQYKQKVMEIIGLTYRDVGTEFDDIILAKNIWKPTALRLIPMDIEVSYRNDNNDIKTMKLLFIKENKDYAIFLDVYPRNLIVFENANRSFFPLW